MSLLPPMGEDAERRLRIEMADWDESRLIAKTVKAPSLAEDVAARQLLAERQVSREARRFHITIIIGVIGLSLSAAAAWFAWKAIPPTIELSPSTAQPSSSAPFGAHTSASSSTPQIQSVPSSATAQPRPAANNR